jgi:hypothetical protein
VIEFIADNWGPWLIITSVAMGAVAMPAFYLAATQAENLSELKKGFVVGLMLTATAVSIAASTLLSIAINSHIARAS